jgi:hypothetical protein
MTTYTSTSATQRSTARFLGNKNTYEVHDLHNPKVNCQISEIKLEHRVPFQTLSDALNAGYNRCKWCLGS